MVSEYSKLTMNAPAGFTFDSVIFASFGTPLGSCGSFSVSKCNTASSVSVVSAACLGKSSCSVDATTKVFGSDPCYGVSKQLAVQLTVGYPGGRLPIII